MRASQIFVVVASALAVGIAWWLFQRDPRLDSLATPAAITSTTSAASAPREASTARGLDQPPASLRDSEVDGELSVDASGHFVPTSRAIALFDYFLSATGEEPAAQIRARILAESARRLPPGAAREAEAFLDRYLAYRADASRAAGDQRLAESADLEQRLQWLRELRRKHFGAELAATLFGDDERAADVAIEERRVEADASLSETEKLARLDALEQQLPDAVRRARHASSAPLRLFQEERALRARGGSDADVRALREEIVGPEATARLEALDQHRAEWKQRLDEYRIERDAIAADAQLDARAREEAIEQARARHFDARERVRVRVIDEMESSASESTAISP